MSEGATAILRMCCPDRSGIIADVSNFIFRNRGNIVHLDQHVDVEADVFFARIEWQLDGFLIPRDGVASAVGDLVRPFECSQFDLDFTDVRPRLALFVTKESHCMYDLLVRHRSGELDVEIPLIISNHEALKTDAENFGVEFHHLPITKATKAKQEGAIQQLLANHAIDTVVLARYMQILSDDFLDEFGKPVINIHHSFLPAFVGAKPYHQAYERGVKIIGATSHYVTAELDQGPIIAQDVIQISHKDSVQDFIRRGRDLEKIVLARAVWQHVRRRILSYDNRTVVF
ncbi:MAG: formyltetrahydrofolate deformylase [Verrucomicrobiales bacterium]